MTADQPRTGDTITTAEQVAREHHVARDGITCRCGHLFTQGADGDTSTVSVALHVAQVSLHTDVTEHAAQTEHVKPTAEQIEAAVERGKEKYAAALDTGTAHGPQNDWITAEVLAILHGKTEAEVRADEAEQIAAEHEREAAERTAKSLVAGVRCMRCNLRYDERDQYSCGEPGSAHDYLATELAEAAEVHVVPLHCGDQLRARAAAHREEAGPEPSRRPTL